MRYLAIMFICAVMTVVPYVHAENAAAKPAPVTDESWTDVTREIRGNPATENGWKRLPEAKVYRDAAGDTLKVTGMFGDMIIDLKENKAFHLKDGERQPSEIKKIFQRNAGLMLVIQTDTVKYRIEFKEEVPGIKYVSGLTAND
ncbi:hypothetical protein JW905_12775 [bacterium]|nr:hypothetical protein [candidate division CSSED10-310 bacterium]